MTARRPPFTTLFRLYDLPPAGESAARGGALGVRFKPLGALDLDAVSRFVETHSRLPPPTIPLLLARDPAPVVVAEGRADEGVVGVGVYDVRSPGTVGPIVVAEGAAGAALAPVLLEQTLHRAYWHGYRYCADSQLDPQSFQHLVEHACMGLDDLDPHASPAERDIEGMPWGDIFLPVDDKLSSLMPAVNPYREGEQSFRVRVAEASERALLVDWVADEFGRGWASELDRGFTRTPISALVAVHEDARLPPHDRLLGFLAADCAALGLSSTIAVHPKVGKWSYRLPIMVAMIAAMIREQRAKGYEYVIGAGTTRRQTILALGGWTILGSYPGPFGHIIAYK